MNKIVVEKYNPNWKIEFEKAKIFYMNLLSKIKIKVEHVGSTSVEGLWAKPILDIDIIVNSTKESKMVIELLESVDYVHLGDLGLEGREAFKYEKNNQYIKWMDHHLYVCIEDCDNLRNHLLIRNHLRNNKESAVAYSKLKRELAEKFPNDIDSYIDGKTELLTEILKQEGMVNEEIEKIELINKID